jgi:5-methylcytosine-specific restriction endonuclease McrA
MNKYHDSQGNSYTESAIKARYSRFLRELYQDAHSSQWCEGCNLRADATAHIVPKARAKSLHKTELIWTKENVFRACHRCNSIAENVSSPEILTLNNIEEIKRVLLKYDEERYNKLPL